MKFASQRAVGGALLLFGACAVPVEIDDDVQIVPEDAGFSVGGSAGAPGTGTGGASGTPGQGGAAPQGGTGGVIGGLGGTGAGAGQGGTGVGGASMAGASGMGGSMLAMGGASGAGMGGTAGTAGAGGTGPTGSCVATGTVNGIDLEVFYTETTANNQIGMTLAIANAGGAMYPMSDLTVRYWFTPNTAATFAASCDFAATATNATVTADVDVTFATQGASSYAEINVDRADNIGLGFNSIQLRLFGMGFPVLTHTDDFSFVDGATNLVNENISAYVDGTQVFGCEPPL